MEGLARGTSRGGVPSSRIAIYKVCNLKECSDAHALAAFDDAIADGVDIITTSMGSAIVPPDFTNDAFSIGSFHAMQRGILTVQSAGNSGRQLGVTISIAPWLLSVAASNSDRRIVDRVVLGNGLSFMGSTINPSASTSKDVPLVYGEDVASNHCNVSQARFCVTECLNATLVNGKIILCDASHGSSRSPSDGAKKPSPKPQPIGVIQPTTLTDVSQESHIPTAYLSTLDYDVVKNYKLSTRSTGAKIFKSEAIKVAAPIAASFSSRGPNSIVPEILKPDITGPGVEILAAVETYYKIMSGTSMSCPHVAGAAAYVKSFHPDWSPSAIKSALMTTAWHMEPTVYGNEDAEFAYGSGHVDPVRATNPGLVYETFKEEYIALLFTLGYNNKKVHTISGEKHSPLKGIHKLTSPSDLNYPSMMAVVQPWRNFKVRFQRRVTNVGAANSTYEANLLMPHYGDKFSFKATVKPSKLEFHSLKENKSFEVEVSGKLPAGVLVPASLVWSDGTHNVRSPVVVYTSVSGLSLSSHI